MKWQLCPRSVRICTYANGCIKYVICARLRTGVEPTVLLDLDYSPASISVEQAHRVGRTYRTILRSILLHKAVIQGHPALYTGNLAQGQAMGYDIDSRILHSEGYTSLVHVFDPSNLGAPFVASMWVVSPDDVQRLVPMDRSRR